MACELFKDRMRAELESINMALLTALDLLPEACYPVASHVIAAGGKRLRPFLTVMVARALCCMRDSIYRLGASMEMLHAATLLHDDILDQADSRRGQPAAHTIFGIHQTILAGDALLAAGNAIVASFRNPELAAIYSSATMATAAGEIQEMTSLGNPLQTEAEYLEIATGKTAELISQACALGAVFSEAPRYQIRAAAEYGLNLGLAFQLVDDALDFYPASQTGKPGGGDLREGKMTLPMQLYRRSLSSEARERFDRSFSTRSFTPEQIKYLVPAIRPFAEKSLSLADDRLADATAALSEFPDWEETQVLREMAEFVRTRKT